MSDVTSVGNNNVEEPGARALIKTLPDNVSLQTIEYDI